jgi:hypothetical protein
MVPYVIVWLRCAGSIWLRHSKYTVGPHYGCTPANMVASANYGYATLMGPRGASNRYIFNRRPAERCCCQIWHGVVKQEDTYSYVISTGTRKLELTTL